MTGPTSEGDIITLLTHDHEVLKHLSAGFQHLGPEAMDEKFRDLVFNLVRHEVAEERIVYPAVRADVLPGDTIASTLTSEEQEIEGLLSTLEQMDPASDSFREVVGVVQSRVLEHLRDEELNMFPLLRDLEADVRRWELGDRYLRAVRSAPTHPHPGVSKLRPVEMMAEPIAALIDRARNATTDASDSEM